MRFELVKAVPPHQAVRLQPHIELDERLRANAVEPPLALRTDRHEACLAQHAQMFRDSRLAHRQPLDERIDRQLAAAQLVENVPPARVGDHLYRARDAHSPEYSSSRI